MRVNGFAGFPTSAGAGLARGLVACVACLLPVLHRLGRDGVMVQLLDPVAEVATWFP
jgi:hypothetical protein